jgi:hypothetical protein
MLELTVMVLGETIYGVLTLLVMTSSRIAGI